MVQLHDRVCAAVAPSQTSHTHTHPTQPKPTTRTGKFFLSWYSNSLLAHGDRVLGAAKSVFDQYNLPIMGKVAGIHWCVPWLCRGCHCAAPNLTRVDNVCTPFARWYLTPQHAAECTAGYYNTNNNNAYLNIAQMFAKHNAGFDFTYVSGGRRGEGVSCSWQLTL